MRETERSGGQTTRPSVLSFGSRLGGHDRRRELVLALLVALLVLREERKVRRLRDRHVARERARDAVLTKAAKRRRVAQLRELPDLLLLDDRLADGLVRLEVGLHAHRVRIDLLAVDDDVDVRHDRLAEEVDVRRQGAAHGGGLALREQRLRVVSPATREQIPSAPMTATPRLMPCPA